MFTKQFLYIAIALILVTITWHFFINILQTEHFSAVKFVMDYDKNMSLKKYTFTSRYTSPFFKKKMPLLALYHLLGICMGKNKHQNILLTFRLAQDDSVITFAF